MNTVTCPRCNGTGRYNAPTRYGPECFRCNGTGRCRPTRERAIKVEPLPDYISLEPCIVSDQSREYYGVKWNRLQIRAAEMAWDRGMREIRRDAVRTNEANYTPRTDLPRYR